MNTKVLLRIAAVCILVHLLGHTAGHLGWDQPADPLMQQVVQHMKGHQSSFMGATKSMADYYTGYSLLLWCTYAMTIALLWTAPSYAREHKIIATKVLYPIGITYLVFGIIEYIHFFPFAAAMSLLAGICTLLGIWRIASK